MKDQLVKLLGLQGGGQLQEVVEIPLEEIQPNPYQPRRLFKEEALLDLARSIREYGVVQPIVVRKRANSFELIAGERRWRSARMAGLLTIPALVREASDGEAAQLALLENLQREDLHFIDEAEGYRRLIDDFHYTQEDLARRLGKSQSTIANKLRLLKLPESVRESLLQSNITERHARAILRLPSSEWQIDALVEIQENGWNVKQIEELVDRWLMHGRQPVSLVAPSIPLEPNSAIIQEVAEKPRRRIRGVFKDARIFINGMRRIVQQIQESGIQAEMSEESGDEWIEVRVRIPKRRKDSSNGPG